MPIFGGKKAEQQPNRPPQMPMQQPMQQQSTPVDEILRLRQQGLSNSQIIEILQQKGLKTHQIFDALNQADIGRTGEPIGGAPYFDDTPMPSPPQDQQAESQPDVQGESQAFEESIEEIAETIIEEKWNELLKDINKIIEWKGTMEANMKALEQRQQDLKQSFESLQKAILSKVNDYDQNITNVSSELKALDKVFQKLLPTFTENVNELSRTVKELKKTK